MKLSTFLSLLVAASASALTIDMRFSDQSPLALPGGVTNGEPVPGDSPIHFCKENNYNRKNDLVDIENISIDPNPPAVGQNLHLDVSGTLKERIDQGSKLFVEVKLGYITLIKKHFDFCDLLTQADANVSCPLEPGYLHVIKDQELPTQIPPGKFIVTAHLFTDEDETNLVTCLHTEVTFKR
ncbi:hypothetical protein H072_7178 [Dactylellina haptotyla CBS 200.50]|uniref:Phosphatidylglycerol/phosphatidylinositol transfer protein n=1 Tax=Dactylellina haptotyla (strain CBS 200.50) TaxID=1284197 RepID=S8BIA9_DACHA|nr:hypothetical protein H072_7178 [Dactylellina haptotyla CBS 200.50]